MFVGLIVLLVFLGVILGGVEGKQRRRLSEKNGIDDDEELPLEKFDLEKARAAAQKTANLIYQRFEFWNEKTYPFFLYSSNMPDYAWDILKYKIAMKMLMKPEAAEDFTMEPKGSQSEGSSNDAKDFLMVFGGSSVTAGHDNYFKESWPLVYERRMKPIFNAMGVRLRVHNIAQGANNCLPSNFCYESMGGYRADWVGWEQSYNCGKANNIFELIARVASWSDAVLYFAASGAFTPDKCKMSPDPIPWISEKWTPEAAGLKEGEPVYPTNDTFKGNADAPVMKKGPHWDHLYKEYKPTQKDVSALRMLLHSGYMAANSVGRFTGAMYPHYNGVAPHGFSVWAKGDEGDAMNFRGPCYEEGGNHWYTKDAAIFSKGSGANWHPPAGMHLLRGEILAWSYAHVTMDAIDMVETALADGGDSPERRVKLIEEYRAKLKKLQKPIPEKPLFCAPDCNTKPLCYTNFEPQYNFQLRLTDLVVGDHEGWVWVRKSGSANNAEKYGYLDVRPCYETKGANTKSIAVKIEIKAGHNNFVKVCSFPMQKEGLRHSHFRLDKYKDPPCSDCSEDAKKEHVRRVLEEEEAKEEGGTAAAAAGAGASSNANVNTTKYELPVLTELQLLSDRKYHGDECHIVNGLPVGKHVLVITSGGPPQQVHSLSHVITW
jgi:hypothetical protein